MQVLGVELDYIRLFYILPCLYVSLGRSIYISLEWLNFRLVLKHISSDYQAKSFRIIFPAVSINSYPDSAYRYTFEVFCFGYMYRKGIFLYDGETPRPSDNTYGIVSIDWLEQFGKGVDVDIESMLDEFFRNIKNKIENK